MATPTRAFVDFLNKNPPLRQFQPGQPTSQKEEPLVHVRRRLSQQRQAAPGQPPHTGRNHTPPPSCTPTRHSYDLKGPQPTGTSLFARPTEPRPETHLPRHPSPQVPVQTRTRAPVFSQVTARPSVPTSLAPINPSPKPQPPPPLIGGRTHDQRITLLASLKQEKQRHGQSVNDFRDRVQAASFRMKTNMLFRMIGSSLTRIRDISLILLIAVPLISFLLRGGRSIPLVYFASAFSALGHFIALPFFTVSLVTHNCEFASHKALLWQHMRRPLPYMAVLVQGRFYASLTVALLQAIGCEPSVWDIARAAILGMIILVMCYLEGAFSIRWVRLVTSVKSMENAMLRVCAKAGAFYLILNMAFFVIAMNYPFADALAVRLTLAFLFSPSPTLGMSEVYHSSQADWAFWRLTLTALIAFWATIWVVKGIDHMHEVVISRTIVNRRDLLLIINGRSWPDQFSLMAHVLSASRGIPIYLPSATTVEYTASDVDLKGAQQLVPRLNRSCYYISTESALRVPEYANNRSVLKTRTQQRVQQLLPRNILKRVARIPYLVLGFGLAPLMRVVPQCYLAAAQLVMAQLATHYFFARLFCWTADPRIFLGMYPCDFTADQISVLTGRTRSRFLSALADPTSLLLSCDAAELVFGDQLFPAFVVRLQALCRSAQIYMSLIDALIGSQVAGTAVIDTNFGSLPSLRKRDAIHRFEAEFMPELEEATSILMGDNVLLCPMLADMEIFIRGWEQKGVWIRFADNTCGLYSKFRRVLLRMCQEALSANLQLVELGLDALYEIARVRLHFQKIGGRDVNAVLPVKDTPAGPGGDSPMAPSNLGQSSDFTGVLGRHFPSLKPEQDEQKKPDTALETTLVELLNLAAPLKQLAEAYAKLPIYPDSFEVDATLAEIGHEMGHFMDQWVPKFALLLHKDLHEITPEFASKLPGRKMKPFGPS